MTLIAELLRKDFDGKIEFLTGATRAWFISEFAPYESYDSQGHKPEGVAPFWHRHLHEAETQLRVTLYNIIDKRRPWAVIWRIEPCVEEHGDGGYIARCRMLMLGERFDGVREVYVPGFGGLR